MATGTVKWFNTTKGYGFIAPDGGGKDVFVHASAVERSDLGSLNEGQTISYEIEQDSRSGKESAVQLRAALGIWRRAGVGTDSFRGRKGSLKLLGSVRGQGVLRTEHGDCEVSYHLDRYQERFGQIATGEVDGDLSKLSGLEDGAVATLVLQDTSEIAVTLSQVQEDGADVEAQGALPQD